MRSKLIVLLLLAGSTAFAGTHFFFGVGVGAPAGYYMAAPPPLPPPPPVVAYRPVCPGPGYVWVSGYWYPHGPRYAWREGYWARRPYARAYWVGPRYYSHHYYGGYWRRW